MAGAAAALLAAFSCNPPPDGLATSDGGNGPRVVFDLEAKPLPEIPLPNNGATVLDPQSPTGRRLNVSLGATTRLETDLRRRIDELDGFGTYQPVTVSFESRLDLDNIRKRHVENLDPQDDAVYLIDIDRSSERFGELVALDAGNGNYPLGCEWPFQYWDLDEHADSPNLLFETHEEDLNGNGKLDPYEDIDFDGVLDHPNTWSGKPIEAIGPDNYVEWLGKPDRPIDDLITFYEKETETLVLWPVVPMRERTTYAVVLTKRLVGENGSPVRSPFRTIHHLQQEKELEPLADALSAAVPSLSLEDVAFAWSFTTQSVTSDLEAIRAGIYGHGPLASLAQEYPPDLEPKIAVGPDEDGKPAERPYFMGTEDLAMLFEAIGGMVLNYAPEVVEALKLDTQHVDYFVLGRYTTPYFLVDGDGIATPKYPADDDEWFRIDLAKGTAAHGPSRVSFLCSIPKTTAEHKPPFPVVVYGHGYSGAPFEIFGFAGRFAQFGYALCGLDAVAHGIALPADEDIPYDTLVPTLLEPMGLLPFYLSMSEARIRDLDNDGKLTSFDNGGDFWSYDMFHTRDMVRQAAVDTMQFIRILRSLGEVQWEADSNGNGKADDRMGDFNGDGTADIGGKGNPYYPVWGQSMGAIIAQVLAGAEATVSAATPISGAGGLAMVGYRSTNPGVPEAVLMPFMGPFVIFTPLEDEADTVEVAFMINHLHRENRPHQVPRPHYYPVLRTAGIRPGDRVVVRNRVSREEVAAFRHPDGRGFRVSLPSDAVSAVEKRPLLGLEDGDTQPVPVSCAPGSWTVPVDEEGMATGPATCPSADLDRALLFGDAWEIEVYDGWDGPLKEKLDRFGIEARYEGAIFPVGAPLVALGAGFGRGRNNPEFRKLIGFASLVLTRGDPVNWAPHYAEAARLDFSYDPGPLPSQASVILYHSIGDPNVAVSTTLALGRASGALEYLPSEFNKGVPDNLRLIDAYVAEGVESFWRHTSSTLTVQDWLANAGKLILDLRWPKEFEAYLALDPPPPLPVHADPDDLDNGTDEFGEPGLDLPVRATAKIDPATGHPRPFAMPATGLVDSPSGFQALRLPFTFPLGAHGVEPSHPGRKFNINNLVENQIAVFMFTDGRKLSDDPCLADSSCPWLPKSVRDAGKKLAEKFPKE
jgi:hypothetical protein